MNTIYNLRVIEFLTESSKIDNIQIDYASPKHQKIRQGYFDAFIESQADARKKDPLNLRKIVHWQHMIADDDTTQLEGKVTSPLESEEVLSSLQDLLEKVNQSLAECKWYNDVEFCKLLGNTLQQFTHLHPFPAEKENGRMARLLANYIATYCGKPLLVFKSTSAEKKAYQIAIASQEKMWIFIAQKIQEAVFSLNGELMFPSPSTKKEDTGRMGILYKSTSGNEELLIQWHQLKGAMEAWSKAK